MSLQTGTRLIAIEDAAPTSDLSPERSLAVAVLLAAVQDAQSNASSGYIHRTARSFCLSPQGAWAHSRREWCERAGLDPDAVYDRLQRLLAPCS